ncbi:MAG: nitroreductase family protein [Bacillota bacterium]|nr:nitroreductase family protein [Bacillota bacterium]
MEFYEVINARKSIKSFKSDPVDNTKLERIVHATMMSPSWKNNTSYKLVMIDDLQEKKSLAETVRNRGASAASAVVTAPVVAVMVGDPNLSGNMDDKDFYLVDSAIAMEHLILAATAEGYGTCWIGALDEDRVRGVLGIPETYRVVAMTPIGVTLEKEAHLPEKDKKDYIFHNRWDSPYQH